MPCPFPVCQAGGEHLCPGHAQAGPDASGHGAGGSRWDGDGFVPRGSFMPTLFPDAALLAGVSEDILCFSRSFEDLTCFWDEKEETTTGMCHFYYWYSR